MENDTIDNGEQSAKSEVLSAQEQREIEDAAADAAFLEAIRNKVGV